MIDMIDDKWKMEWDGKGMCNNYKKSPYIAGTQYERQYHKYELTL